MLNSFCSTKHHKYKALYRQNNRSIGEIQPFVPWYASSTHYLSLLLSMGQLVGPTSIYVKPVS